MDPLSVLSIAGSAAATAKLAWSVGVGLHNFFSDGKAFGQTVSDLAAEVKALSNACTLVDERLRDIVRDFDAEIRKPRADEGKLWACIEAQVLESQKSIGQLHAAFQNVQKEGSNKLKQAWGQILITIQAKDINEARNRLRSHTTSLQTILQTVAIEVCYLAPQRADQQLRVLISRVEDCMFVLKELRQERTETSSDTFGNEVDILEICGDAVSNGESLYAASVAEGSLLDFPGSPPGTINIQQWMADLSAIEETVAVPPTNDRESISAVTPTNSLSAGIGDISNPGESRTATSATEYEDSIRTSQCAGEAEIDSDDEFSVELAQAALGVAQSFFDNHDYQEADSYLQEALKMVRELPAKRQSICDTWNVRYMLSVCAYHLHRSADAEVKLLSVIENSSRINNASREQLRQVCAAGHLLSQLYIKLGNLAHARLYCDNALQGRRRLLGKSHDETYQSFALRARIYQLEGNDQRAKVYLSLVDDSKREELERTFSELSFSTSVSEEYESTRRLGEPEDTTVITQQTQRESCEPTTITSPDVTASVESTQPTALEPGSTPELRSAEALAGIVNTARNISTSSAKSVMSDDSYAASTSVSLNPTESVQNSACMIVVCTTLGEFHVAVTTNVKATSTAVSPNAWTDFCTEVRSGKHNGTALHRQERRRGVRLKTFIEGCSAAGLKILINPSTMDFGLEQKEPRHLRVEGTVVTGKETITKIMTFRPGIWRGGSVEVIDWEIHERTWCL